MAQQLATSFKAIANKKSIEKITIKEITDMTNIIRPTFYSYFQDKYQVLEWIVENELMIPCKEKMKQGLFKQGTLDFLDTMLIDSKFYQNCIRLEGQNSFKDILREAIRGTILTLIDEETLAKLIWFRWLTTKSIADFFAEAVTYAIVEWVKTGMTVPKEEIWECFLYLTTHSIEDMILGIYNDPKEA